MADTTFSIELKGLALDDRIKNALNGQLRSVVLSELAKTDLGAELSVKPLQPNGERVFAKTSPILGFILENLGKLTERNAVPSGPSLLFTPPASVKTAMTLLGSSSGSSQPFDGAPLADVLEALYYRPDVRAAVASNARAFVELLSRNEDATKAFGEIVGGDSGESTERFFGTMTPLYLAISTGVILGLMSRK